MSWIARYYLIASLAVPFLFFYSKSLAQGSREGTGSANAEIIKVVPPDSMHHQVIPIPIYATNPSEGSTYGIMPVVLSVHDQTGRIESIYAPSISFNDVIKNTATFRYYHYPNEDQNFTVVGSVSSHVNWNAVISWQNLPLSRGSWTDEFNIRIQRDIFARYFGYGPFSLASGESSYTRIHEHIYYRRGLNLSRHFNLGARFEVGHDLVQDIGIQGIATAPVVFPNTPGMNSSGYSFEGVDLRYDDRPAHEYSLSGFYADLQGGAAQGLWRSPAYYQAQLETRALFRETPWLNGSARFFTRYVSSKQVPFYNQSSLGGSFLLRGFTEGRFVDQGAWTAELEQRFRALRTHIFGVIADWQVDPFFDFGQVFVSSGDLVERIRLAEGIGFRAWVHPNISGRVDIAYGGEGAKVYVELGYPY
jgi:outer membrane protein assembly factor BamA